MYACIDLGSNSFHLLIAQWQDERSQIVERFSHIVQLGEGVTITGEISPAAFARGMQSLQEFRDVMSRYPIQQYWALGTNALRLARNAPEFIQAAHELGIDVSVISGIQEATLVYLGVLSGLPRNDDTRLVVDIGGGSTELVIGRQAQRLVTTSLPIGCVSWRDKYFQEAAKASPARLELALESATNAAFEVFNAAYKGFEKIPWDAAYASSGTAKMLAMICHYRGHEEGSISLLALEAMRADVLTCAADPERLLPGLKDSRKNLLLPGWSVLVGLMQALQLTSIRFSPTALREGMLDFMMRNGADTRILAEDSLPEVTQNEL